VEAISQKIQPKNEEAFFLTATFENLNPATQYLSRVGSKKKFSKWYESTTAARTASQFSFVYFGHAQNSIGFSAHQSRHSCQRQLAPTNPPGHTRCVCRRRLPGLLPITKTEPFLRFL
jgi:hypothetical protein